MTRLALTLIVPSDLPEGLQGQIVRAIGKAVGEKDCDLDIAKRVDMDDDFTELYVRPLARHSWASSSDPIPAQRQRQG